MTKSRIMIMLLALVLAISVIGGCFALYVINADNIGITLTTGQSITLLWGDSSGELNGVVSPAWGDPSNTANVETWTLHLTTKSAVDDANEKGTFKISIANDTENTEGTDIASLLKVSTSEYSDDQLKAGVQIGLKGLKDTPKEMVITVTFTGTAEDWDKWAEQKAIITASWNIDTFEPVAGDWYLVGKINGTESWTPHTSSGVGLYKLDSNSHSIDETLNTGDGVGENSDNRAQIESVYLKAQDAVKIFRYYQNGNLQSVYEGNFKGYNGSVANLTAEMIDKDGNFVAPADGYYSFYVNANWEIWISYTATAE